MLHERHFKAMGTDVGVWLWSDDIEAPAALDGVRSLFETFEDELSRFRKTSGLCRLNSQAGKGPQPVSPLLRDAIALALEKAKQTGGLFDPTILPALQNAGYNASFEQVAARPEDPRPLGAAGTRARWQELVLGPGTVALPAGTALDLGGVVKGWTVDLVAEQLRPLGPALVDAGGDVRSSGTVEGKAWPVGVEDPLNPGKTLAVVRLDDEAVATSSVGRRRWKRRGQWMHHLIDPRTQQPVASDLHTVTVVAPRAHDAEIHTKMAILLGSEAGAGYLRDANLEAVLVRHDGTISVVGTRLAEALPPKPSRPKVFGR